MEKQSGKGGGVSLPVSSEAGPLVPGRAQGGSRWGPVGRHYLKRG